MPIVPKRFVAPMLETPTIIEVKIRGIIIILRSFINITPKETNRSYKAIRMSDERINKKLFLI